jgi:transposase
MAQKTINMNVVKQVLQLSKDGVSIKEIVRRIGVSRKTVRKYLRMLQQLPLQQQIEGQPPINVSDKELADVVYNNDASPFVGRRLENLMEHFEYAKKERYKTGVNKQILWVEYLEKYPDGYKYSQYCRLFMVYLKNSDAAFHWDYKPAEFTQVDFAGKKFFYVNKETSQSVGCNVFVGILPYSGLIFCMAVVSQKTEDFVHCINEMVKYFGGLTKTILCDNLKTAVTTADRYEPVFTEICHQLSDHYNTTFSATRPKEPTDKGMVEKAVGIVYTNIYAPLRNETPGSLELVNRQFRKCLDILNIKHYKGNTESRRDIFTAGEQPLLKELPETPFVLKKRKQVIVQRNYAIQLPDNKHYYTVPHQHVGHKVWVHFDQRSVEVYYNFEMIAIHPRSSTEPKFNRINEHMPPNHQYMVETQGWTIEDLLTRAGWIGNYTRQTADRIIHSSFYPEQNFKACNAMIMLYKKYNKSRLEAACQRAANITRPTLKLIKNILIKELDKQPQLFEKEESRTPAHGNIRGSGNYQ